MKTWIKTNFQKITSILALFLAIIGLIMGGVLTHESNKLNKFLKPNHEWVFGDTTIWEHKNDSDPSNIIYLYFANKPTESDDFKWDGKYPEGYFVN